uniref:Conotoxin superfamily conkunitzin-6 n=1 Tax=Conus magus TaxID=6492 RepID=A0A5P8I0I7_CONMA|nr:conotoxin superfamily conkunitzin-6 [Conus magus]
MKERHFTSVLILLAITCMMETSSQRKKPDKCHERVDLGLDCGKSAETRYYYNNNTGTCESFDYLGCEANRNNFINEAYCKFTCVQT